MLLTEGQVHLSVQLSEYFSVISLYKNFLNNEIKVEWALQVFVPNS